MVKAASSIIFENQDNHQNTKHDENKDHEVSELQRSCTTAMMISKFRQLERNDTEKDEQQFGPRPLKCFTPPPEGDNAVNYNRYSRGSSLDSCSSANDEYDEDNGDEYNGLSDEREDPENSKYGLITTAENDEALQQVERSYLFFSFPIFVPCSMFLVSFKIC